jgi:hypothetical protein
VGKWSLCPQGVIRLPEGSPPRRRKREKLVNRLSERRVLDQLISAVRRAAARLGIPAQSEEPAVQAGLVRFGTRVRFRHPLLRYAAYHSASSPERRDIHAALAQAPTQGWSQSAAVATATCQRLCARWTP